MKKIIVGIIAVLMMVTMLTGCESTHIEKTMRIAGDNQIEVTEREYDENGNMIRQDYYFVESVDAVFEN